MSKLNEKVQKLLSEVKVFPVATASKDGVPNVVPFAFGKYYEEDTILLADNFMNKSLKNLEENPRLAMYICSEDGKEAYQIKGEVTLIKSGKVYEETVQWVKGVMEALTPKTAILLKVTNVYICHPGSDLGKEL